jgi:hypothetical protein
MMAVFMRRIMRERRDAVKHLTRDAIKRRHAMRSNDASPRAPRKFFVTARETFL